MSVRLVGRFCSWRLSWGSFRTSKGLDYMLTKEQAEKFVAYDQDSGVLTWKYDNKYHKIGDVAGHNNGSGYLSIRLNGRPYLVHRVAWLLMMGKFPDGQLDHKNLDKEDNRWSNLRGATPTLNQANTEKRSNNTSGFKCVYWDNRYCKWRVRMWIGNHFRSMGSYISKHEAHAAYCEVAQRVYGEYARTN